MEQVAVAVITAVVVVVVVVAVVVVIIGVVVVDISILFFAWPSGAPGSCHLPQAWDARRVEHRLGLGEDRHAWDRWRDDVPETWGFLLSDDKLLAITF